MLNTGTKSKRHDRSRELEGRGDRRIATQHRIPESPRVNSIGDGQAREPSRRQHKAGACDPVIEPQAVHPAFVHDVMDRGPVVGKWTRRQSRHDIVHATHVAEVTVHETRSGVRVGKAGGDAELTREESARAGRVDHEARVQLERVAVACAPETHPVGTQLRASQLGAVAIIDARVHRASHEMMVHVGAEPVRVRDRVARARGHQEPLGFETVVLERLPRMMPVEGEATLEATPKIREMLQPAPVSGEPIAVGERIAAGYPLEREVGQRRG